MKKAAVEAIDAFLRPSSIELASCLIPPRDNPPAWIPKCLSGNMGRDHGFLLFTPDERQRILDREPSLEPCFRQCVGAYEHLRGIERWCLWTTGMDLDIQASPFLMDVDRRLTAWRLSQKGTTRQYAAICSQTPEIRAGDPAGRHCLDCRSCRVLYGVLLHSRVHISSRNHIA